jgi:hypothetical protein
MTSHTLLLAALGSSVDKDGLAGRLRTSFIDDKGRAIFIELSGVNNNKYLPPRMLELPFRVIGFVNEIEILVDASFHGITQDLFPIRGEFFDYTDKGVLDFINSQFGTKFVEVDISYTGKVFQDKVVIS